MFEIVIQDKTVLKIIRVNEFTSDRKMMSVIAIDQKEGVVFQFVKGAPESILKISNTASIPENYQPVLNNYT